jgi:hypothetical protein
MMHALAWLPASLDCTKRRLLFANEGRRDFGGRSDHFDQHSSRCTDWICHLPHVRVVQLFSESHAIQLIRTVYCKKHRRRAVAPLDDDDTPPLARLPVQELVTKDEFSNACTATNRFLPFRDLRAISQGNQQANLWSSMCKHVIRSNGEGGKNESC